MQPSEFFDLLLPNAVAGPLRANHQPPSLGQHAVSGFQLPSDHHQMVEGEGFEPSKAKPADLQSAPVDRLGTPPRTKAPHSGVVYTMCQRRERNLMSGNGAGSGT